MRRRIPVFLALAVAVSAQAQPADTRRAVFFSDASVQSSVQELGAITRFDGALGYSARRHWTVRLGIPVYVVRPSSSAQAATGAANVNGLGNVYAQIRFDVENRRLNYSSILTGTAPTGDRTQGLSIGHATVDWTHAVNRTFGRFTPFADVGLANAVSDTMFFVRPYITSGFITHAQAGTVIRLSRIVTVTGSGYAILPAGQQTVTSRIAGAGPQNNTSNTTSSMARAAGNAGSGSGSGFAGPRGPGASRGVFEGSSVSTGSSSIARDNGVSAWLSIQPRSGLQFFGGYTRSTQFDLNVLSLGTSWRLPWKTTR